MLPVENGFEKVTVNGLDQISHTICRYHHHGMSNIYIGVFIFLALLTVIVAIVCVISIIKIKSNKRLNCERLPSSEQVNDVPTASTSTSNNNVGISRDLSNLPPIGSAEAEFQNDFIPVFPMRQLEPCPEKNTTALQLQYNSER
ncbi:hypothetical protein B4U80_01829 [Leptotrombidium deliense]|uniref:Uncharacterized protein n=1 Tax=Leptotrombidium deliense TaxID=299467 RepID=A0A443S7X8_9ACAR|nr:hypothetical protein B4U80_01829 [Leptotrombidium deliense]